MTLKQDIEAVSGDPAGLERLYRDAHEEGKGAAFKEALRQLEEERPGDLLLEAWAHRLDLPVKRTEDERNRNWWMVVGASVVLGIISVLFAQGLPPVPFPDESAPLFWVGWGPLIAVGLIGYLAWTQRSIRNLWGYAAAAVTVVVAAIFVGLTMGSRTGDAAFLSSVHLLFVSWTLVGAALCLGYPDPSRQSFAYLVKSVEALLTGGIFFGAGLIFVGLTYGIFAVLGIELPEEDLVVVAAWGVGAIPLLAIGSVYDPSASPAAQDWQAGLTRTLRILARLLLPLALGVLLVYVGWFIPVYFHKAFEEREVLIVYNASILAIMVLLAVVVSGPGDAQLFRRRSIFQYAVFALGALTLILNAYALAAVVSRTLESGLTPNRYAVTGWNVTTLLILASTGFRLWQRRAQPWPSVLRESLGMLAALAGVWAVSLLIVLPFFG